MRNFHVENVPQTGQLVCILSVLWVVQIHGKRGQKNRSLPTRAREGEVGEEKVNKLNSRFIVFVCFLVCTSTRDMMMTVLVLGRETYYCYRI